MAKYTIGVGDDFPVDEPPPGQGRDGEARGGRDGEPGPHRRDGDPHHSHHHGRAGRFHFLFHVLLRIVFVALAVSGIVWLLQPHFYGPYVYAPYHYAYHPHFFFSPVIFVLIIVALFAFHGHHHRHHRHGDRWHGGDRHGGHWHGHHHRHRHGGDAEEV